MGEFEEEFFIMFVRLKEIEIGFENVEGVKIPAQYVSVLCMDGIKDFRRSFQNDEEGLAMCRGTYAERIILKINKSAKGKLTSNEGNEIFQRLTRYRDIVDIKLKYSDGVEETICSDWENATKGGEENLLQNNSCDDGGNLIIEIGKFIQNQ